MAQSTSLWTYVKAAFTNRWHLLALFASVGAGAISGHADVILPLVGAVEVGFLGMIATNPRFHRAVDAQQGLKRSAQVMVARFQNLYQGLDARSRAQFDELRSRGDALRGLVGKEGPLTELDQVSRAQLSGVNRLLWVYLKLLHTRMTLERFFQSTDPAQLDQLERNAQQRMQELNKDQGALAEKMRASVADTLATIAARRGNMQKAQENHQFVCLELERIAAKLTGIAEMAVNRQDPGLITHDVDDVARSVQATEEAIGELQAYTGLTAEDDQAPDIVTPLRTR